MARRDATLDRLSAYDWSVHMNEILPNVGATVRRLVDGGADPKQIQIIRSLVYERVSRSGVGVGAALAK
jgi:hypothetical protein